MSTRKIGPVLATFVVANNMIGSGFFLLPASLAASGAVTVFSWIAVTVLALVLGGAFARLARDYPDLSSAYDYVPPSLGRDARSEGLRVGTGVFGKGRSRWSPVYLKKKPQ